MVVAVAVVAVASMLGGCSRDQWGAAAPDERGNIAITRSGDRLLVAFCDDMMSIDYFMVGGTRRIPLVGYSKTYAEFLGDPASAFDLPAGFIYRTGDDLPRVKFSSASSPDFDTVQAIDVVVEGDRGEDVSILVLRTIEVPQGGVPSDQWLGVDGKLASRPCPA